MSVNRENVIWPSADGSWNRGFYECHQTGEDFEWDVEYDYGHFSWCSTGHATEQEAGNARPGANPGGAMVYSSVGPETEALDRLADAWKAEQARFERRPFSLR